MPVGSSLAVVWSKMNPWVNALTVAGERGCWGLASSVPVCWASFWVTRVPGLGVEVSVVPGEDVCGFIWDKVPVPA